MRTPRWSRAPTSLRCTPRYASSARKMNSPSATQVSVSCMASIMATSTLERFAHGGADLVIGRHRPDQALDDGGGGPRRDRADIAHGGGAGRSDRLLRGGEPLVQLRLEPFVGRLGLGRLLFPGFGGDA